MAKRNIALASHPLRPPDPDLDPWRVAHDLRCGLAGALLRLRLFERTHGSASARQAAVLIQGVLSKLDDLEEERPTLPDHLTASRPGPSHRVGHA